MTDEQTNSADPATLRRLAAECREGIGLRDVAEALEAAAEMAEQVTSRDAFAERADEHKSQVIAELQRDLDRITGYHRAKQEECAEIEAALKKLQSLRWDLTTERDAARTEADQMRAQRDAYAVQLDNANRREISARREATEAVEQRDVYRERCQQLAARVSDLEKLLATADKVIEGKS